MAMRAKAKVAKRSRATLSARANANGASVRRGRQGKVRKEFWLDPELLRAAKAYLGTATEREAVELALDLVGFRRELVAGVGALRGLPLIDIEPYPAI